MLHPLAAFTIESVTALIIAITALAGVLMTAAAQVISTLRGTHTVATTAKAQSDSNGQQIAGLIRLVMQVAAAAPSVAAAAKDAGATLNAMRSAAPLSPAATLQTLTQSPPFSRS